MENNWNNVFCRITTMKGDKFAEFTPSQIKVAIARAKKKEYSDLCEIERKKGFVSRIFNW